ncbi:MAG: DUF4398 domain-containing protein [Acidobacteria bacterium]|nr:DUF4398 domain-containing protein [Acidobacteriota bacterium]
MRRWSWRAVIAAACLVSACADPPNKEIDQAQGAIDAARAAGGERYAATEYTAATTSLKDANDAVTQRDYRLALNHALASREHAQNAAREAADGKARTGAEVERTMAEIAGLLAQANTRIAAAQRARVPARLLRQPAADIEAANADVQKSGEAMNADDYLGAQATLKGVKERIEKATAAVEEATTSQSPRRRR